ncbi:hypothetical protein FSP39_008833 [Pinctada imbricata]|uniref:Globin domain-containing protein n=1 Tax=Pinctada imbricata TaxID=66713 RepID=A0AA89BN75_PINIB|nr:hypothetical protein FSP39_008833 [Pinctada imbricata]
MQEQLKKLFTSLMIPNGQSYLIDEEKLRQHAVIVMEGLGAAVESLEDSIYLTNLLIAMGERHYNYKVRPDMLGRFFCNRTCFKIQRSCDVQYVIGQGYKERGVNSDT